MRRRICTPLRVLNLPDGQHGRKLCTPVGTQLGYAGGMTELEKGPQGRRRGRGARERILSASQQLFRDQGINRTGMDQLCAAAQVSKRTAYQHFTGKDELVAEYLRRFDPDVMPGVFDRTDLTPRERLLAAFEVPATGRTTSRRCAPTSRRPSRSTTLSTPHASTHATTRKPSPRGSPKPPAKPAPPTPNSSASNWRCSSMAPRPAPGSSTPTPSPLPPPSPPSSSTTPSPTTAQRGGGIHNDGHERPGRTIRGSARALRVRAGRPRERLRASRELPASAGS